MSLFNIKNILLLCFMVFGVFCLDREFANKLGKAAITYGSSLRLEHVASKTYQHSADIKYGAGSGGQTVTGFNESADEFNSLWILKEGHNQPVKSTLKQLRCGDIIRLEHVSTHRNLHCSDHKSSIGNKWEVSAFGDQGKGDDNDSWKVFCDGWKYDNEIIKGADIFHLIHVKKDAWLYAHQNYHYNQRNCGYNCPIMNNLEISGDDDKSYFTKWKVYSGIILLNDPEIDSNVTETPNYEKDEEQFEVDL